VIKQIAALWQILNDSSIVWKDLASVSGRIPEPCGHPWKQYQRSDITMGLIGDWWRQSDHFDWIIGYLRARRMTGHAGAIMTVTSASFGAMPLLLLLSPYGPTGAVHVSFAFVAGAGGLACALLWGLRRPSRRTSLAFVLLAGASNTLFCLSQPDPRIALLVCSGYATIAGYIAFFHTAPLHGL
jgi:hypothetical protein